MTCDWAIVCETASFSAPAPGARLPRGQLLSLMNVIEHVTVLTKPTLATPARASFTIVAHLTGATQRTDIGLRVASPTGNEGAAPWFEAWPFEHADPYLIFRFVDFDFLEEGVYRFELLFDGVVARTVPVPVVAWPSAGDVTH